MFNDQFIANLQLINFESWFWNMSWNCDRFWWFTSMCQLVCSTAFCYLQIYYTVSQKKTVPVLFF